MSFDFLGRDISKFSYFSLGPFGIFFQYGGDLSLPPIGTEILYRETSDAYFDEATYLGLKPVYITTRIQDDAVDNKPELYRLGKIPSDQLENETITDLLARYCLQFRKSQTCPSNKCLWIDDDGNNGFCFANHKYENGFSIGDRPPKTSLHQDPTVIVDIIQKPCVLQDNEIKIVSDNWQIKNIIDFDRYQVISLDDFKIPESLINNKLKPMIHRHLSLIKNYDEQYSREYRRQPILGIVSGSFTGKIDPDTGKVRQESSSNVSFLKLIHLFNDFINQFYLQSRSILEDSVANYTLYRRVSTGLLENISVGGYFIEPIPFSTTWSSKFALEWGGNQCCILIIQTPINYPVLALSFPIGYENEINQHGEHHNQKQLEVAMKPTKFKVLGKRTILSEGKKYLGIIVKPEPLSASEFYNSFQPPLVNNTDERVRSIGREIVETLPNP